MISFRYHIASLVAVLLALAAGVALGSGPLQRDDEPVSSDTAAPKASGEDSRYADFNNAFASSVRASMVGTVLKARAVTVVVLPGAPQDEVAAVTGALGEAGAAVTGTVRLGAELVDPSNKQLVDELGGQLEATATKVTVATGAASYERIGTLLAHAIGTKTQAGDAVDDQGRGILAGLSTANLLTTDAPLARRGNLVLVVAGSPADDEEEALGAASIVRSLVRAIDAGTGGVVVAGPPAAADPAGVVTGVREDPAAAEAVSTVDSADVPAGVIVTMLALYEQAAGKAGQYGAGAGATGPRPGVTATN